MTDFVGVYNRRWSAFLKLILKIKNKAIEEGLQIYYDGSLITPDQLVITENECYVHEDNTHYIVYHNDCCYDEGALDTIPETEKRIRSLFKLIKIVEY